jgi:methyl-accepting chemotaxis protein WspA
VLGSTTLSLALGALVAAGLVALLLMRRRAKYVRLLMAAAARISEGEVADTIKGSGRGEIGVLIGAFNKVVVAQRGIIKVVGRMALGDFSTPIRARSERDTMTLAFVRMVDGLVELISQIHQCGIQINSSMNEIAATSKQQHATVVETAATTAQLGATSKEISATALTLVRTMGDVAKVAEQSAALAGDGREGLGRMENVMQQVTEAAETINARLTALSSHAEKISTVVTTITKIADQTNLLSLNAAIEAEKAGEYGRGFSVVATEIRRLADQTAVSTFDIANMVKGIQSAVAAGLMGMDRFSEQTHRGIDEIRRVSSQLAQIIKHTQALAPQIGQLDEGMSAQASGAEQITEALMQLGEASRETVESLRQSGQAIDSLNDVAVRLRDGVSRFKIAA